LINERDNVIINKHKKGEENMIKLNPDIPYRKPVIFASFVYNNEKYNIFFNKAYGDKINGQLVPSLSRYYIQIYKDKIDGDYPTLCAYIYFYLNFEMKETKYIGTWVDPECRNKGFASLLTSLWTWICMDNNFYEYVTNRKQRKPFLLYLLKLYGFEINDVMKYDKSKGTILICRDLSSKDKCIYFKDEQLAKGFARSKIFKSDNYQILNSLDNAEILDKILLSTPYHLQDCEKAYTRSRTNLENHGII